MEPAEHLDHLRRELAGFDAELDGDLDADVPGCPGWDLATLVGHVGQVHRFALLQLVAGPGAELDLERGPAPTERNRLIPWYREGAQQLVSELEATDPDEHRPNWAGAPTARFYFRRMANEMAVHRWDAQSAHGDPAPIDADLAIDGVDELGEIYLARIDASTLGEGRSIHLHATDGDGEWMFTVAGERLEVTREHGKGDAAARAPASELVLMLWNRRGVEAAEVFGDDDLLGRFVAAFRGL